MEALELARSSGQRGQEGAALFALGQVAAHPEPPDVDAAEGSYSQAMAIAVEGGFRPVVAHCHLSLGKLYKRTGKRQEAQEHVAAATTMYREMGMTYWLEQAETEFKAL